MKMNNVKLFLGMFLSLGLLMLAACGGSSSSGTAAPGTLSLQMVDATTPDFKAIYVTIDRVDVHSEGGAWTTVATPQKTYNLLELVNGVQETLGEKELAPGNYTQMRLLLSKAPDEGLNLLGEEHDFANYFITQSDEIHELMVPSGLQTGIKLVNTFTIASNEETQLILDFDAARSVVVAGSSGKHILKPTIKVVSSAATVQGRVVEDGTEVPLPGTRISAHAIDSAVTQAATLSSDEDANTLEEEAGHYALFLNPGDYQLVAFRTPMDEQGYAAACRQISLAADQRLAGQNFFLEPADFNTLSGEVTVAAPVEGQYVVLSLRQEAPAPCSGTVELASIQIEDGLYEIDLPVGTYQLIATLLDVNSEPVGDPQVIEDVSITTEATTELNIAF